ncbi:MAG: DUF418 domain-containing protein [Bacteroidales bacterium]|nr:DUF418 domain-containing protein [Bacteroidales bacterium]
MVYKSEENRIPVADSLRGFAIIAIALLHSINHYNLYQFPEQTIPFLQWTDRFIETIIRAISSGKAYGIFAILFGFTFYIQLSRQAIQGKDFKYRFIWRMFLLFLIGNINSLFFAWEILILYSIIGLILVALRHTKYRILMAIILVFMLQPLILTKIVYILVDQNYVQNFEKYLPNDLYHQLTENSFFEMIKANLTTGKKLYWMSILSNGERVFQTGAFFIIGMLIGRKGLFEHSAYSDKFWKNSFIGFLTAFIVLKWVMFLVKAYVMTGPLQNMTEYLLTTWSDFSVVIMIIAIFMKIYSNPIKLKLKWAEQLGKMSLTNYLAQSILGSFLFYGYGLSLSKYCGVTASLFVGIFILFLQYYFCTWWLKQHVKGPMEQLWHNLTWMNFKKVHFD